MNYSVDKVYITASVHLVTKVTELNGKIYPMMTTLAKERMMVV
ncbi:hypothetical protein [Sphingobacterium sp.]|nr:hypothetical protein [Sphingobacterium sp.]